MGVLTLSSPTRHTGCPSWGRDGTMMFHALKFGRNACGCLSRGGTCFPSVALEHITEWS